MIQNTSFLGISLRTLAHRRALVIAYYALLLAFVAVPLYRHKLMTTALVAQSFLLGTLFGGLKAGGPVKSYAETPAPEEVNPLTTLNLSGRLPFRRGYLLDERERATRDHAHYVAYRLLLLSLFVATFAVFLSLHWTLTFFNENSTTLLWLLLVVALSLPQAVILWTEPEPMGEGTLTLVGSKT